MSARQFSTAEWDAIMTRLEQSPISYGFPKRVYGSGLIGSFNIRKLGSDRSRNERTWQFLTHICRQYDLLAVQEIMDDLSGIRGLMKRLGPEFGLIVSDKTGIFPGEPGVGERLGFIFRWSVVQRTQVATDITYDRTKVLNILNDNLTQISSAFQDYDKKLQDYENGERKTNPNLKMPVFLTFIRQPFCVSFRIVGYPGTEPYEFMAINAHLYFGKYMTDRRQEFDALMEWILSRVRENEKAYYPNFMLLGDLNLDFDSPDNDRKQIEKHMKTFNDASGEAVNVNFPFLDIHPTQTVYYRTNARMSETFDQIGLFFRESGLPTYLDNATMGQKERGPDYGVFNFVKLFDDALNTRKKLADMAPDEKKAFYCRFEHKVSDHIPIWLRLPLPG
jgi:hypothetical protein